MKLIKNLLIALLGPLLMASPVIGKISQATGLPDWLACLALLAFACVLYLVFPSKKREGVYVASVDVEVWVNYIIERLWRDNKFLQFAWNDDQYVVGAKTVHIPQPGSPASIAVDRSSFPATAGQRTDTDIIYTLHEFSIAPTFVQYSEQAIISYDKINSIIGDLMGYLTQAVADNMLLNWADESVSTPTKIYTSGGAAAVGTDDIATALTGTRNVALAADMRRAKLQLDLQNIPAQDRFACLEANMMDQILGDLSQTQYRDFSKVADPAKGTIGQLFGFNILERSSTITYNSVNALNAYGATSAATDKYASIFWHQSAVSRALGQCQVFYDAKRPEYYGDIVSGLVRAGGRRRRGDDKGVVMLIAA